MNNPLRILSTGLSVATTSVSSAALGALSALASRTLSLTTSTITTLNKAKHIWHSPAYYKKVLEIVRLLNHAKLSMVFRDLRGQILAKIQSGHLEVNGELFKLNAEFVSFFSPQNLNQSTQIEPVEIVRLKNILDFILKLEELFFEIENVPMQDLDPERFTHRLRTFGPMLWSFRSLKKKGHIIFENLMQLNNEMESLFTTDNSLISNLLFRVLNIFSAVQESTSGEIPALENLSERFSSESQKIKESLLDVDLSSVIGRFLGMGIRMMDPHQPNTSPFWSQAISKVPSAITALTEKITSISQNFEGYEKTKSSAALLKKRIEGVIKDLEYFYTSDLLFAFKLIPVLYNLNEIFDVFKLFIKNLGHVNFHLQMLLKEKLRVLKFDLMSNIVIFLDELEVELMLQPGQLSEKFLFKLESNYSCLIDFLSDYVVFDDLEDEDILRLYDAQWHHARLEASYSRKAKHALLLQQHNLEHQKLGTLQTINDLATFKLIFAFLAPYSKQLSPRVYNDILASLEAGEFPELNEEFIEHLNLLFNQYLQSSIFAECRLNQSHVYLEVLQTKMALFLESGEEASEQQLKRRLGNSPALIRLNEQFYFYDGCNHEQPLKMLQEFPLQLVAMPKNVIRYLDTHELNSLLLTVGHTLSRPLALKSLQVTYNPTRHYSLDINESLILNLKEDGVTQVTDTGSLDLVSLFKLLEAYRSFFFKIDEIENNLNQFFNDIKAIYSGSPESILDVDSKNAFALSLTKIGVYIGTTQLRQLSTILGRYTTINISSLQSWASINHLPLLARIASIKEENLIRYQDLSLIYSQKMDFELALKYEQLMPLPRADYFLSSTARSSYLRNLELNLKRLIAGFSPQLQEFLIYQDHEGGFEDLLEFKTYLAQPQQVLLFKWLLNTVVASRQFFERMESLKRNDFTNGLTELSDKIDLVQSFLNAWQYLYKGIGLAYHQNMFINFGQTTTNLVVGVWNKFDYFQIQNDTNKPLSSFDKMIHWFLNGSEILDHLASSEEDNIALKHRLELNSVQTLQKIDVIVSSSNSYLKLIANTPLIYNVLTLFKSQLANLPKTVYDLNYKNLLQLRGAFFAEIMHAVEKLELDLGIQPAYLSKPFSQILDVIFEHYLIAINPDLSIYSKVMLDVSLENKRLAFYETELANSAIRHMHIDAQDKVFAPFIDAFETNKQHFRALPDSSPELLDFKKMFKDGIAPKLKELQHLQHGQTEPELRTSDVRFWDERFSRWIAETAIDLNTTGYINFIRNCHSYFQGILNTERSKQQLLREKYTELQDLKKAKTAGINSKLAQYLETYYDHYVSQCINQSSPPLKYLAEDCQLILRSNFDEIRRANLESLGQRLIEEYQKPFHFNLEKSISDGVMYQAVGALCSKKLAEIKDSVLVKYYVLDRVLESIVLFEGYSRFVEAKLDAAHTDIFEDSTTLAIKKANLEQLQAIILNREVPINDRFNQVQQIIQDPNFKNVMLGRKHSNGHWVQQFLFACYQGFLEFLAFLKLYDLQYANTKQHVSNMQQTFKVTRHPFALLSNQTFFANLHAPVEADSISLSI